MKAIGALIRKARKQAGYTSQGKFAAALGVHLVTVTNWERGLRVPNDDNLAAISKLTGEPIDALKDAAASSVSDSSEQAGQTVTSPDTLRRHPSPDGEPKAKGAEVAAVTDPFGGLRWRWEQLATKADKQAFLDWLQDAAKSFKSGAVPGHRAARKRASK